MPDPATAEAGQPAVNADADAASASPASDIAAPTSDDGAASPAMDPGADAAPSPGRSRARWLIGGGIAVAAVAALVAAATLLGARPLPEVLGYLPADSAIVVELRPELPGDQRQHLGNFLAHFPGFDDQSILDLKIDESLDRIIGQSSGGSVDYATQVKPLLAGPMAFAVNSAGLGDLMTGELPTGLLLVATTDGKATCETVFGSTTAGETHRDVELRTIDGLRSPVSCGVHGRFMLLGTADAIRAGLDARLDGKGVSGNATYRTAREALEGDQLATVFADGAALEDLIVDAAGLVGQPLAQSPIPAWTMAGLRVVDDAIVFDARSAAVAAPSLPPGVPSLAPATTSRFAANLPADTLGFVEIHGLGALTMRGLAVMRADPAQAEALGQIEAGMAMLGGIDNLVTWIEDLGVAVMPTADAVGGALLIRGTDADAAAARVTQVRNLLVLAATGTDMTVHDADHGGVTVTTVDLGDLSTLLGGLGVPGDFGDVRLEFGMAARGDLVIVGFGSGVVEGILDVEAAQSLEQTATYSRSVQLAGDTNDVQIFMAIDSTLALVERLVPAAELGTYTTDVKPYTDHLAGAAVAATGATPSTNARFVFTVK
jgi:hypothetical protein